jgi:hypothetical protein
MVVEDAILSIQIQEGVTDARFGQAGSSFSCSLYLLCITDSTDILNQNRRKALHCRIAEDVEDAVVEVLAPRPPDRKPPPLSGHTAPPS